MLGQGDRGGGGPAARATEGNAGPVPFLDSLVERQRWAGLLSKHTLGDTFAVGAFVGEEVLLGEACERAEMRAAEVGDLCGLPVVEAVAARHGF